VNSTHRPNSPTADSAAPCARCGYPRSPGQPCERCDAVAGAPEPEARAATWTLGLVALPRGLSLLMGTPGWMWLLALPTVGSCALLALVGSALWRFGADRWGRWQEQPPDFGDGPWAERGESLVAAAADSSWTSGLAGVLGALLLLVFGWYLFALAFEVVLGPFLDELHGRVERRRYGREDVERAGRPPGLSTAQVTRRSSIAGALAIALSLGGWLAVSPRVGLLLAPAPFLGASLLEPAYGRWLIWALGVEGRLLAVGLGIAAFALVLVVALLPVTLLPVVGVPLYALGVGFGTALSLLDLPAARRGWSVGLRWRFARRHALPLALFGAFSSLLFAIPLVGVLLGVPSASLGALWLLERLEKPGATR
jgi:uncharacterized protein involved in cysteine biosynthesis